MKIRINQLELPPGYPHEGLLKAAARALRCAPSTLNELQTVRRSVDARGRAVRVIVSVETDYPGKIPDGAGNVERVHPSVSAPRPHPIHRGSQRPLVVGAGPAGLMAAYSLAEAGLRPLLIERGEAAGPRATRVSSFWMDGTLDVESNVLYGEGGAGLFSDGKLTSRSKDRQRVRRFLEILVGCGASGDILIDAEPHIGSDVLTELVPVLRNRIIEMGGEVRFKTRLDRLEITDGVLREAVMGDNVFRTDKCVLATGHSARDVYHMLSAQGVRLEPKPFAVGLRLEMPQQRIDRAQWGGPIPALGSASFRLTRREEEGARACYTFCMCPGGIVICCASSPGLMTTNGMSLSQRDKPFGNAAFLVPVFPQDFQNTGDPATSGIAYQQQAEAAAFAAGGANYSLPAQRLVEFLQGETPSGLPALRSCTLATPAQLRGLLPGFVERTLRRAIPKMLQGMRGVQLDEALLYASETRSSSPVRIPRGEDGQSVNARGLYPCGEGSGHAGGIVSSGIDGLRIAESILE